MPRPLAAPAGTPYIRDVGRERGRTTRMHVQAPHEGHRDHAPPVALPFERKVERWASALSCSLAGARSPFVLLLAPDGRVRSVSFEHPASSWFAQANALAEAGERFLFYDPLEGSGRAFITWAGVDRRTLERLLGAPLTDADFVAESRDTPSAFPPAWDAVIERVEV